jgi:hypothetical protein
MNTIMVQLHLTKPNPTPKDVAALLKLPIKQIDASFGVITTDPAENLYTVMIDEAAAAKVEKIIAARKAHPAEGIFSNPKIEPFGTPEK